MTAAAVTFRFEADSHTYTDLVTGEILQHTTGMLTRTGWIDDTWMTDESRARGQAVHKLTADYDLGALDLKSCVTPYRPYLLAHVAAMQILRLELLAIEEAIVHPVHLYGCRPDRVVDDQGEVGPFEVKSTDGPAKHHALQTALQALALEHKLRIPAEHQKRQALYLYPNGRFKVFEHRDRADLQLAREIIRATCGGR